MRMEVHMKKGLFFCLIIGLLMITATGEASSPDEWVKYEKEVASACTRASGLKKAEVMGGIIFFGDDIGFDAVMVRGRYPQPHMKNAEGHALCMFNKKTRKAQCSEANEWFNPGKQ
jgi:hypothetical protein